MTLKGFVCCFVFTTMTACTTTSPKDDIKMHFGDLPENPFVIAKDKKGER